MLEGFAIYDFLKERRLFIGTLFEKASDVIEKFYRPFVRQRNPIIFNKARYAEFTKYTIVEFQLISNYQDYIFKDRNL